MRKPATGEPCAGEPHARFGGQGGKSLPDPYHFLGYLGFLDKTDAHPPGLLVCARNDTFLTLDCCSVPGMTRFLTPDSLSSQE